MTTAIAFSRQNDAGAHVCTTKYWRNLILVVILVLESKVLLFFHIFYNTPRTFRDFALCLKLFAGLYSTLSIKGNRQTTARPHFRQNRPPTSNRAKVNWRLTDVGLYSRNTYPQHFSVIKMMRFWDNVKSVIIWVFAFFVNGCLSSSCHNSW